MLSSNLFWSKGNKDKAHLFEWHNAYDSYRAYCDSRIHLDTYIECDDYCSRCYNYVVNYANYCKENGIEECVSAKLL